MSYVSQAEKERKKAQLKKERRAKIMIWIARRSSRNRSFIDRLCRQLIEKALFKQPENDFLRDEEIDNDLGFDADELERYQRGDAVSPSQKVSVNC